MAEQKRHRDVPQGAFFGKALPSASAPKAQINMSRRIIQTKTPPTANGGGVFSFRAGNKPQATSAICNRIFFMAFFSSWRIRSADTPYLSASSCSVDLLSDNQRSRRIS